MNFIDVQASRALAEIGDPSRGIALRRNAAADLVAALIDFLDDTDADPDLEPSIGWGPFGDDLEGGDVQDEPHDAGDDDEPSLGAPEPSYALAEIFWPPTGTLFGPALPRGSQEGWAQGGKSDLEDEHDGLEPENEHGPSWSEPGEEQRQALLVSGSDEGDEPTLGFTEHIDQVSRTRTTSEWSFGDGEADYVAVTKRGRMRARSADDEGGRRIVGGGSGRL
ncbi:MAG: hypothetical protein ABIQ30_04065 [Devosia sp.]